MAKHGLATAATFLLVGLSAAKSLAAPVQFYDENLQSCVDEHMAENAWLSAADVTFLNCSGRSIADAAGIEQLPNLTRLDLSSNPLQHLGLLQGLQLREVNLSHTRLYELHDLVSQNSLEQLFLNNVTFQGPETPSQRESVLYGLLGDNPNLTHLGSTGFRSKTPTSFSTTYPEAW